MATAIRQAQAEDVTAIAVLVDAAYQQYVPILGRKPRPMNDDHAGRTERGENFVLVDGDKLLAVIALVEQKPDALQIFSVAVDPAFQGHGLLHQLLRFAEDEARHRGLPMLALYTNQLMTRNRKIYAHLGFIEVGVEEAGDYKVVFMERPVPAA